MIILVTKISPNMSSATTSKRALDEGDEEEQQDMAKRSKLATTADGTPSTSAAPAASASTTPSAAASPSVVELHFRFLCSNSDAGSLIGRGGSTVAGMCDCGQCVLMVLLLCVPWCFGA
jgi:hypothetical protein